MCERQWLWQIVPVLQSVCGRQVAVADVVRDSLYVDRALCVFLRVQLHACVASASRTRVADSPKAKPVCIYTLRVQGTCLRACMGVWLFMVHVQPGSAMQIMCVREPAATSPVPHCRDFRPSPPPFCARDRKVCMRQSAVCVCMCIVVAVCVCVCCVGV